MDLTTATPAEIDAEIARLSYDIAKQQSRADGYAQSLSKGRKRGLAPAEAEKLEGWIQESEAKIKELQAQLRPYHNEFDRRGGWTRAFIVTNANGHIHRSMDCTTCYARTQFEWLTQLSDHDEQEIVDLAGDRACTVCYASAPVELRLDRKSQLFTQEEHEKQLRKAELAWKKANPAEAKALKNAEKKLDTAEYKLRSAEQQIKWAGQDIEYLYIRLDSGALDHLLVEEAKRDLVKQQERQAKYAEMLPQLHEDVVKARWVVEGLKAARGPLL